jgi:hypothetical protein
MVFKAHRITDDGTLETFHEDPDRPGQYIVQKTFDREPIIESCTRIRNELDQRGNELRLAMRVPPTVFWQWIKDGTLGPDDYKEHNGGIAIEPKKLAQCMREYSALSCMDKL